MPKCALQSGVFQAVWVCLFVNEPYLALCLPVPEQSQAIVIYTGWERHALVGSDIRLSCSFFSWRWTSEDVTFSWTYRPDGSRDTISVMHKFTLTNHMYLISVVLDGRVNIWSRRHPVKTMCRRVKFSGQVWSRPHWSSKLIEIVTGL